MTMTPLRTIIGPGPRLLGGFAAEIAMRNTLLVPCLMLALAGCAGPDDDGVADDGFHVDAEIQAIPTVVRLTWTEDGGGEAGRVEIGLDTGYGRIIEATADGAGYEALVLGLKPDHTYHYRLIVEDGGESRVSGDRTFTTGVAPSFLGALSVTAGAAEDGPTGLLVTSLLDVDGVAVVVDRDGDYLWWYRVGTLAHEDHYLITRALLSVDGESMLYVSWTPLYPDGPVVDPRNLVRVSLDGSTMEVVQVPGAHHDFVECPDGTIAVLTFDPRTVEDAELIGDAIIEVDPDGNQTQLWSSWDTFEPVTEELTPGNHWSHANAIDCDAELDAYIVSLRNLNTIIAVQRGSGEVLWQFGGEGSDFDLDSGTPTEHQHQFQRLDDGLLVFDNGEDGAYASRVVEYALDHGTGEADTVREIVPDPAIGAYALGDASRLPAGDTLITWSTAGRLETISAEGAVSWRMDLEMGSGFGYTTHVESW